jgi:hypothetical protein
MSAIYVGLATAVVGAGTAAYGASQSKKAADQAANAGKNIKQRSYAQELMDTLKAQGKIAPDLYKLEEQYQPKYAALYLDTLRSMRGRQAAVTKQQQDIYNQAMGRQRLQDMATLQGVAPEYVQSYLEAMPGVGNLNLMLTDQAQQELAQGGALTPEQERAIQQSSRAAYAARGTGLTDQAALGEVLNRYNFSQQREAQRRQFAQQVMQQSAALSAPALQRVMGRETADLGYQTGLGALQQSMSAGPRLFNPESPYAGNMYNQMYQQQLTQAAAERSARAQEAQAYSQLAAAGLSMAGSAAGGYMNYAGQTAKPTATPTA